jgi:hypothetical protein
MSIPKLRSRSSMLRVLTTRRTRASAWSKSVTEHERQIAALRAASNTQATG